MNDDTSPNLVNTLRTRRAEWQWLLWHDIGAARMLEADAIGVWSVKDVIAHIGAYERYAADMLVAHARGKSIPPSATPEALASFAQMHGYPDFGSPLIDDDSANDSVYRKNADIPLHVIVEDERITFERLIDTMQELGNDRLLGERFFDRSLAALIEDNTWGHYEQHSEDLRDWLENSQLTALDHVQLAIPAGQDKIARAFYVNVLGLREVEKPEPLAGRGGLWLERGALKLHLGVEEFFQPARKAHPALLTGDLAELRARCHAAGVQLQDDVDLPGYRRMFVFDPFGNRIELVQRLETER